MTAAVSCPKPQDLQQLLLGRLDEATAEVLERHIQDCPRCGAALPSMVVEDSLVASMRAVAPNPLLDGEREAVEALSQRLQRQGPGFAEDSVPNLTTDHTLANDPAPPLAQEHFGFLAPSQSMDELGRLGGYRVLKVLGRGGMGVVFLAEDSQLQRTVALKAMLPDVAQKASARERFLREARAAARIEHDHVVTIHQVGEDRGVPFLVMPLLQGESMDDWLRRREQERPGKPATVTELLRLGREIAAGLAAAHARGLIHRDVKPANVWLDAGANGRVKLLDFGLARPTQDQTHLTHSGVIVGTPSYMSPEQARGGTVDGRADLWSLGVVLYRLCTGRLPFAGTDVMSTLMQAALEPPPPLRQLNPEVPPELAALIDRLMAKESDDRPASASAVIDELRQMERRLDATTTDLPRVAAAPPRRRRWALVAVLVLLVGGAVAGGIVYVQTDKGLLKIESLDDDVKVIVEQNGKLITVLDRKNGTEVVLRSGEYRLRVEDEKNVKVDRDTVRITRGKVEVARIEWLPAPIVDQPATVPGSAQEKWLQEMRKLPPDLLGKAVADRLKERNPGFDGTFEYRSLGGGAWHFGLCTDAVTDLTPLQALDGISKLHLRLNGSAAGMGRLVDLSPLRGLRVVYLEARCNPIADVSPLQALPLGQLYLTNVSVADLRPLTRIRGLWGLHFISEVPADLSPLSQMPLTSVLLAMPKAGPSDALKTRLRSMYTLEWINDEKAIAFWKKYDPDQAALLQWRDDTKKLPATQQLAAILKKLHELNPDFDGKDTGHHVQDGRLVELQLPTNDIGDIRPLIAATELTTLRLSAGWPTKGKVRDLSPVAVCRKLVNLSIQENPVEDLSPLRGLPLTNLNANGGRFRSLAPLEGMPLKSLTLSAAWYVADLAPLRGMPLEHLTLNVTGVRDLSPLDGLALVDLDIRDAKVPDLEAVKRFTKLKHLSCGVQIKRDAPLLRSMWNLEKINDQSVIEFWKQHDPGHAAHLQWIADTRKLPAEKQLEAVKARLRERNLGCDIEFGEMRVFDGKVVVFKFIAADVTDISPLRAFPSLGVLTCGGDFKHLSKLSDLSPLRGMPSLKNLYVTHSAVTDLTPLRGAPLITVYCNNSPVQDLLPLTTLPLQELRCDYKPERDAAILRTIKTLQTINGKPAAEVLTSAEPTKP
jgi:Leucine-rich repeat (LRR) protein